MKILKFYLNLWNPINERLLCGGFQSLFVVLSMVEDLCAVYFVCLIVYFPCYHHQNKAYIFIDTSSKTMGLCEHENIYSEWTKH